MKNTKSLTAQQYEVFEYFTRHYDYIKKIAFIYEAKEMFDTSLQDCIVIYNELSERFDYGD